MKKAINLIIMYFVTLICGILIGTLFYSFYLNVLNFVAGQKLEIWDADILIESLFYVAVAMCFLIFPILSYYRSRHVGGVPQTITYILLTILTIAVVFPASIQLQKKYYDKFPQSNRITHLSGNYFRQNGDKVYYFTRDFISNPVTQENTTAIIIDTSESGKVMIEEVEDTPDFELYEAAKPFKEILAKKAFEGSVVSTGRGNISTLVNKANEAYDKGFSFCLGFLSVALAFASIYAMTAFFQWKLLNAFLIIVNSCVFIGVMGFYATPGADKIRNALENNRLMDWCKGYVDDPALVCFYVLIAIIFTVVGIVNSAVKKHKKRA